MYDKLIINRWITDALLFDNTHARKLFIKALIYSLNYLLIINHPSIELSKMWDTRNKGDQGIFCKLFKSLVITSFYQLIVTIEGDTDKLYCTRHHIEYMTIILINYFCKYMNHIYFFSILQNIIAFVSLPKSPR